jgi:methylmalonyl-CoA mutase
MDKDDNKLFSDFEAVSTPMWEAQILKDLKGADYEKKLVWKTDDNIKVKPYYRSEDLESINWLKAFPGKFPFVRGNKPARNEWLVRQNIKVNDIKAANEKALDILMKGVDSLGLKLDPHKRYTLEDLELLLKNVRADIAEINFFRNPHQLEIVGIIEKLVRKYNRDFDKINGSVNYDPLACFARKGVWHNSEEEDFCTAFEIIKAAEKLPKLRVIGVNGHIFTNAGATIAQEMALSLSMGSEYLTRLTDKDMLIGQVAPRIKFNLAVGSNYFMEIAKLRAYRLLWAKIVNAYGLFDAMNGRMFIHATNASWNLSLYDPHVNLLRTTTGSMSAILGGVDSFSVLPFNAVFEEPTTFSERIARNQQLVIKEESYFDKVADPAAGSYYIEKLTESLVEEAWKLFLELDEKGGFVANLKNGHIQKIVAESAAKRNMNIATRKEIILGTNQYPNAGEMKKQAIDTRIFEADDTTQAAATIETIKTYRGAQAFELMRYKTDRHSQTAKRPVAWMFTFGNPVMRKARAGFATNFFACAGFETVDNPGFETIEKGIEACRAAKPEIVVICSSDEEYADKALTIFKALKNDHIVVLAGYPTEIIEQLKAEGMENFIHMRSNVLETLKGFQKEMGIL